MLGAEAKATHMKEGTFRSFTAIGPIEVKTDAFAIRRFPMTPVWSFGSLASLLSSTFALALILLVPEPLARLGLEVLLLGFSPRRISRS